MLITRLWREQPGRYFCISTKSPTKKWKDNFFKRSQLKTVEQFIEENHDKDVYFCPHGFSRPRRIKGNAVIPKILWSDLDEVDPRSIDIKPTVAIESSPGRFVGLWMIDQEMTEELNRRLAYAIGADKSGWDLTQVLRVPKTINYKYPSMPRVRILWSDGDHYSAKQLERKLPPLTNGHDTSTESSDAADIYRRYNAKLPAWLRRELFKGKPEPGKRSEMIWKIEHTLLERGLSPDEAFTLIKASPWNKFRGRANEDEQLRRELNKVVNAHLRADAPVGEEGNERDYVFLSKPLSEVEEEEIDWLWYPYLALGELTILEGDPGLGKSYLAQMVSGSIIDGLDLPSPRRERLAKGKVVYFDMENTASTVTKKRMTTNGFKNLDGFYQEEYPFSIDDDDVMDEVYEALERVKPTLVVFDTLNTYLGKADAFKGHEAQQAFARFREIAIRFKCAVLVLRHLTKSTKERALYRGQGSMSFTGLARVVITMGVMPDDPETRAFAITKINVAKVPKALTFTIESIPDTLKTRDQSKFVWGDYVDLTADQIVAPPSKNEGGPSPKDQAEDFLRETLADGEEDAEKLTRQAEARSISRRTLYRAAESMGIVKKSVGFGKGKRSFWSLP